MSGAPPSATYSSATRAAPLSLSEAARVLTDPQLFTSTDKPSLTSDACPRHSQGGSVHCSGSLPRSAQTDVHYTKKLVVSSEALIDSLSHSSTIRAHTRTRLLSLPLKVLPSIHHCSKPAHPTVRMVTQREWKPQGWGLTAYGKAGAAAHALGATEEAKAAASKKLTEQLTAEKRARGAGVRNTQPKKKFWSTAGGTNHELVFELYVRRLSLFTHSHSWHIQLT
jgi:hypothetical protein